MTPLVVVTTSWDDGHRLDLPMAELLDKYGIPATFYVAPENLELAPRDRLSPAGLSELATHFEIGGHTLRHRRLPQLGVDDARDEMQSGKYWLEDSLGEPVTSFCYPRGEYLPEHVAMAADIGFDVARTVRRGYTDVGSPLEMPTTMHAYQHLTDAVLAVRLAGPRPWAAPRFYAEWDRMAMRWFDVCRTRGGVYHLWGHSWEVDARGDWKRLENVLAYISGRPDVQYVANRHVPGLVASA